MKLDKTLINTIIDDVRKRNKISVRVYKVTLRCIILALLLIDSDNEIYIGVNNEMLATESYITFWKILVIARNWNVY